METIRDVNVKNKKVLVRVDFNIAPGEDWRINAHLPTINYLLKHNAKVILISHSGRPGGKVVPELSLKPLEKKLPKGVTLLENLRFDPGEEANSKKFALDLAFLADIYVNDAFSVSHRKHASIVGIAKYLPSYAGLLLEKEIKALTKEFKQPLVMIMAGAKVETKLPMIKSMLEKVDQLLLGGLLANVVLAGHTLEITSTKLHLPVDAVTETKVCAVGNVPQGEHILDIGPDTIELFLSIIKQAKTIIWNGPMGKFEQKRYAKGTEEIGKAVAERGLMNQTHGRDKSRPYTIVGGGDTIAALNKLNLLAKIDHVSTGGGAMLEYFIKGSLPGIEALK